jgi:RNA polymerase sigma factor (sigma-70 family)
MSNKINTTELLNYVDIFNKYEYLIEKYIIKICPEQIDNEDLIQDARVELLDYIQNNESFHNLSSQSIKTSYVTKHMFSVIDRLYKSYLSCKKSLSLNDFKDNLYNDIYNDYDITDMSNMINLALNTLPEREAKYLKMYYFDKLSMAKIGSLEGFSAETVRRVLGKAIRHMRHPSRSRGLKIYIED